MNLCMANANSAPHQSPPQGLSVCCFWVLQRMVNRLLPLLGA